MRYPMMPDMPEDPTLEDVYTADIAAANPTPGEAAEADIVKAEKDAKHNEKMAKADEVWRSIKSDRPVDHRSAFAQGYGLTDGIVPNNAVEYEGGPGLFGHDPKTGERVTKDFPDGIDVTELVNSQQNVLAGKKAPYTDIPALAEAAAKIKERKQFEAGVPNTWDEEHKQIAWDAAQAWSLQNELTMRLRRLQEQSVPSDVPKKRTHDETMALPEWEKAARVALNYKFGADTFNDQNVAAQAGRDLIQVFEANFIQAGIDWAMVAAAPMEVKQAWADLLDMWVQGTDTEWSASNIGRNLLYGILDPSNLVGFATTGGMVKASTAAMRAYLKGALTRGTAKTLAKEAATATGKRALEGSVAGAVAGGGTAAAELGVSGKEMDAGKIGTGAAAGAALGTAAAVGLPETFTAIGKVGQFALKKALKIAPDGVSAFAGRRMIDVGNGADLPELSMEAAASRLMLDEHLSPNDPTNVIYDSLIRQGVDKAEAEANANVVGSLYSTMASKYDITPEELYRAHPYHIKLEDRNLQEAASEALQSLQQKKPVDYAPAVPVPPRLTQAVGLDAALETARASKFATNKDLKNVLQAKALDELKAAGIDPANPIQMHDHTVKAAVQDVAVALRENANAIGWYDTKVRESLAVMSKIHPELTTDPNAAGAFKWALAVTSNGQDVETNFKLANLAYEAFKATGKMPTDLGAGTSQKQIAKGLALYNTLVEKWGPEKLDKFMNTEFTASEIGRITGIEIEGELADTVVKGSAILGPKIGNGFYSNLNGDYSRLTMDRWLMRTWGRWTGSLVVENPQLLKDHTANLKDTVKSIPKASRKQIEDLIGVPLNSPLEELAVAVNKASIAKAKREALIAIPGGDALRLTGNRLADTLDGQKEAPQNGSERAQIRNTFDSALDILRKNGYPELTMADLQASIWYPERRLYDIGKSADEIAANYADDAAPDYSNAAAKYAEGRGISREEIDAARASVRGATDGQRTGDARSGSGLEQAQPSQQPGAGVSAGRGFDPKERKQFAVEGVFDQIRSGRKPDGEPSWAYERSSKPAPRRGRSIGGEKVAVVNEYNPQIKVRNALKVAGLTAPKIYETADPAHFQKTISELNKTNKWHASVNVYSPEEYANMRTFMSEDGRAGLALTSDGNIVSGFNADPGSGTIHALFEVAIAEGGRKADAFDTVLPTIYAAHGMKPVSRVSWDDAQAPAGWNKETYKDYNNGEPDVVLMVYDPEYRGTGKRSEGVRTATWDEAVAKQTAEVERLGDVLYQGRGQEVPRGEYSPGQRMARIFAGSDASTIPHETAHHFLELTGQLAAAPNAPAAVLADFADAMKWLGTDVDAWGKMSFEERRPFHEKYAQAFEQYLKDGQAPTEGLQRIFDSFREWLTKIYKSAEELGEPISPEARAYFDNVMRGPSKPRDPYGFFPSMKREAAAAVAGGGETLQQRYTNRNDYINRLARGYQNTGVPVVEKPKVVSEKAGEAPAPVPVKEGETLQQAPIVDPVKAMQTVGGIVADRPETPPAGKYIESGTINVERHAPGARADRPPGQISIDDFNNMKNADDVAALLDRIGDEMGFSEEARTMDEVMRADIKKELTPILGGKQTGLATDKQLYAMRSMVATLGTETVDLAKQIANGSTDAATVLKYQRTGLALVTMQSMLTKNVREIARALAQQRYIAKLFDANDTKALQAGLQDITDPQALIYNAQALIKKMENNAEKNMTPEAKAAADAKALGDSIKKRTFLEAAVEYWTAQILTGPTTHIVNMSANLAKDIYDIGFLHPMAAAIGSVRTTFQKNQEKVYWREVLPAYHGAVQGLWDGLLAVGHVIKTGESKLELSGPAGAGAMQSEKLGRTGALEGYITQKMPTHPDAARRIARAGTLSFTALSAEDEIFKTVGYRSELSKLAVRKGIDNGLEGQALKDFITDTMNDIPDDLHRAALEKAKELTFQQSDMGGGLIGFLASKAKEITSRYPALKFLVPFITTPANVVNAGLDASILAVLNPKIWRGLQAGGAQADMAAAKLAGGAILTAAGFLLYQQGAITGDGPEDPAQRKMLEATGWQRNSIRIGDKYHSYDRLDPLATPLVTIASLLDRSRFQRREIDPLLDTMSAVAAAGDHFIDLPFLTGVADLVKLREYGPKYAASMVGKIAAGFIPFSSATATMARTMTPETSGATRQEVGFGGSGSGMDLIDEAMAQIKLRLPFARDGIRPGRYWDGEIQMAPVGGAVAPLNPMPTRRAREDKATEMLVKYGVNAPEPTPIINIGEGISVDLLDFDRQQGKVYDAYLVEVGKARKAAVTEALKDPIFGKPDEKDIDGEKPLLLQQAINAGKTEGTDAFVNNVLPRMVKSGELDLAPLAVSMGKSVDRLIMDIQKGKIKSSRATGRFKNEQQTTKTISPSGTGAPRL